jgi:hypothetical protein
MGNWRSGSPPFQQNRVRAGSDLAVQGTKLLVFGGQKSADGNFSSGRSDKIARRRHGPATRARGRERAWFAARWRDRATAKIPCYKASSLRT